MRLTLFLLVVPNLLFAQSNSAPLSQNEVMIRSLLLNNERLRYLAVSKAMAERSVEINNQELSALLALQAFQFHWKFPGYRFENKLFLALTSALTKYGAFPSELKQVNDFMRKP